MLDVRRLAVLAAAVRERSIAAAARSLDITPSAASQAIGALEAQAGARLLVRGARGVVPTAAGERLTAHAEAVLAQLAIAELELAGGDHDVLRVAAFATAVSGLLPSTLARLRAATPPVLAQVAGACTHRTVVLELEPDAARAALSAGAADVALVNHHAVSAPDQGSPWRVLHLFDEPVLAAVPSAHRLIPRPGGRSKADNAKLDIADLAGDDWVMQAAASPCQELVVRACADAGFAPRVSATCADYHSILRLVQVGHGVALVPRLALGDRVPTGVRLLPLVTPLARRVNALVPPDRADRPAILSFVAALRETVRGEGASAKGS